MMKINAPALLLVLLAGCAVVPQGPNVAVMPGPGKNFDQFIEDDKVCRAFASQSTGTNVNDVGANNVLTGAAVGTALGAAAGALIGGHNAPENGAAAGLIMGSAVGTGNASSAQYDTQRRYDIAYEQCMYSKGNQLPQASTTTTYYGGYSSPPVTVYHAPPMMPPPPPPPPGAPPPPPPGY